MEAGQGLIGEPFHPYDFALDGGPSDGESQNHFRGQRGPAEYLDPNPACRKVVGRGFVGSTIEGKRKFDFFRNPGFFSLIRAVLSAEIDSASGARNERTAVRNKNVVTAFRAGNSKHDNFSGIRASSLRGSFFFL